MTASGRAKRRNRLRRSLLWTAAAIGAVLVAGAVGAAVLIRTPTGRDFALEWAMGRLRPLLAPSAQLHVGSVGPGGLLGGAVLRDVRIEDAAGRAVLAADSVRARYSLVELLGSAPGVAGLRVWSPRVVLAPGAGLGDLFASADDDPTGPSSPDPEGDAGSAFVVRGARIHDGLVLQRTEQGGERRIEGIEAAFRRIDARPRAGVHVRARVDSAAARYRLAGGRGDALPVSAAAGDLEYTDEGVVLEARRFRLPGSVGSGRAVARRDPGGAWTTALELREGRLALADLAWIDPRLDRGTVRLEGGRVGSGPAGLSVDAARAEVRLDGGRLELSGGFSQVRSGRRSAGSFRAMNIGSDGLAPDAAWRWLPQPRSLSRAVPEGAVFAGGVQLDGPLDRLVVSGVLAVLGERGDTVARVSGDGRFTGDGSVREMRVEASAPDGRFAQALFPRLPGDGWNDFRGHAQGVLSTGLRIALEARRASAANLPAAGAQPDSIGFDGTLFGAVQVDSLVGRLALGPASLPRLGAVRGTVALSGPPDRLAAQAALETDGGPLVAEGRVNLRNPSAGYDVSVTARDFRLSEVTAQAPAPTVVSAVARLSGSGLDLETAEGVLEVAAGRSSVARAPVDTVDARVRAKNGRIHLEAFFAQVGGVAFRGAGGLAASATALAAWPAAERGAGVRIAFSAPSIAPLRPLLMDEGLVAVDDLLSGIGADAAPAARDRRFGGSVDGRIRLSGHLGPGGLAAEATAAFRDLEYGARSARALDLDVSAEGRPLVATGNARADSVVVGRFRFRSARAEGSFVPDDGRIAVGRGRLHVHASRSGDESYEAQAVVRLGDDEGRIDLDRLVLVFDHRRWSLAGPARFEWDPETLHLRDFGLVRPGAPGFRLRAAGRLATTWGESDFEFDARDLDLALAGRLLHLDAPPEGVLSARVRAAGDAADPRWEADLRIDNAKFRSLRFDRIAADGTYAARAVALRAESWTGDKKTLAVNGTAPLDLRLTGVQDRVPDEALDLNAVADSFPLALLLGGLTSLEGVVGNVSGSVAVKGRPGAPAPSGTLRVEDGAAFVAPLGVALSDAQARMALRPDGIVAVEAFASSGGDVQVRGTVDASRPADPVFDLAFWPRELQVVDRRDMEAAVSGDSVVLTGPFSAPFVEGALNVDDGTVFLEEFQRSAQTVDIYDRALFDAATAHIGAGGGGVRSRNPFLANLRVLVQLHVGRGSWLRSRNMNIETEGDLEVIFDRQANQLVLLGSVDVVRGTYGLANRNFTMTDGEFRFVGTPGFNPNISLSAQSRLRARDGRPMTINADISGTLLAFDVTPSSDAGALVSEDDLYSYLFVGQPASALVGQAPTASVGAGMNLLVGQAANQIGYLLAQQLNLDHLSVSQAEQGMANAAFGASSLQVEAGRYLLDNVFLTGVYQRGYCADPTLPVNSRGVRVEVGLPKDVTLEGFVEDRCTREGFRGLGGLSLQLARIWGFSLFREWGY